MKRRWIVFLSVAICTSAGPIAAQTVPPDQSCGGLLCDMGVFGHKVAPAPAAAPPPSQAAAMPRPAPVVVVEPKVQKALRRTKRIARASVKPVLSKPVPAAPAVAAAAPVIAPPVIAPPVVAAPAPALAAPMVPQPNPAAMFRPIYE